MRLRVRRLSHDPRRLRRQWLRAKYGMVTRAGKQRRPPRRNSKSVHRSQEVSYERGDRSIPIDSVRSNGAEIAPRALKCVCTTSVSLHTAQTCRDGWTDALWRLCGEGTSGGSAWNVRSKLGQSAKQSRSPPLTPLGGFQRVQSQSPRKTRSETRPDIR